ncbi:MAG: phosphatase PAP2 family protein [Armatimonadetes bacterium]|nr:phosphatase PAP2 family protein [Armatimonadota bacterium]
MDWLSPSIPFIAALQKLDFLVVPAKILSFLGNEEWFLLLLPLVYWCISRKTGARLGVLLLLSVSLNDILKVFFALPRPYWGGEVVALATEKSFGFPSGHAQNAALLWPFLALRSRNPRSWVPLALLLALAIAFSRLVLGVHYPADALGGALVGFALLGLWLWRGEVAIDQWRDANLPARLGVSALTVACLGIAYYGAFLFPLNGAGTERDFVAAYVEAWKGGGIVSRLGALFGLLVGLSLAPKFEAVGPITQRIGRLLIGFAGLALFYFGLKMVLPDELPFRFARYALTTFWIAFGAPWAFEKIGLSQQKRRVA